jgi:hypothetical protein
MSFILRLVVALIIFSFVVYVFKAIARLSFHLKGTMKDLRGIRDRMDDRAWQSGEVSAEMVRCLHCSAFVSSRDAITLRAGGRLSFFCSEQCLKSEKLRA